MGYTSTINTGLPNLPDPPDPTFFAEFTRVYNAIRNLTVAIDAYCGTLAADPSIYSQTPITATVRNQNLLRLYIPFGVTITPGQTVHLYNNAGVLTAELSDSSAAGKPIHGWCSIGATAGNFGEVMLGGLCTLIGGLTPGATYYAGNTPGTVAPTAGTVSQKVGFALGASLLYMQPQLI